jgi:hypothetical protein
LRPDVQGLCHGEVALFVRFIPVYRYASKMVYWLSRVKALHNVPGLAYDTVDDFLDANYVLD